MNERCRNCGAELFAGQQFCRQCGARTGVLTHDDVATQILPGQPTTAPPPTATAPLGGERRQTDPNFPPYATAGYGAPQPVVPLGATMPAAPPARRRGISFGWILLAFFVLFVGTMGAGGFYVYVHNIKPLAREIRGITPPKAPVPPRPPVPADPAEDTEEDTLDEDDADVTDNKTVITKTFALTPEEGEFEVTNLNGDITVEGWDGDQAEVKVTKRGGDPDEREQTEIKLERKGAHLALHTEQNGGAGGQEVTYEVKLPRRLQQVKLNTMNGNVKLTGLHAGVEIATQNGNVKLEDVGGAVATKTLHGNTKIILPETGRDAAQTFNTLNGNIEVELKGTVNADVKAEATTGAIDVDDALGLTVVRQIVGQRAAGRLGQGGPALVFKTLSGNIKIKQ
jgi:hypothetical protein